MQLSKTAQNNLEDLRVGAEGLQKDKLYFYIVYDTNGGLREFQANSADVLLENMSEIACEDFAPGEKMVLYHVPDGIKLRDSTLHAGAFLWLERDIRQQVMGQLRNPETGSYE